MKPDPDVTEAIQKIRKCLRYNGDLVVRYRGCAKEYLDAKILSILKGCLDDIEAINKLENNWVTEQEIYLLKRLIDGTTSLEWVAFHIGQLSAYLSNSRVFRGETINPHDSDAQVQ